MNKGLKAELQSLKEKMIKTERHKRQQKKIDVAGNTIKSETIDKNKMERIMSFK